MHLNDEKGWLTLKCVLQLACLPHLDSFVGRSCQHEAFLRNDSHCPHCWLMTWDGHNKKKKKKYWIHVNETEGENLTPTCNSMTPFATSRPAVLAHAVEPSSHKAINMQAVLVSLTQYNWTSVSVTLFSAWHQLAIQLKCDRSGNQQHRILIVSLILSFRNITASLSQSHYQNQDSFKVLSHDLTSCIQNELEDKFLCSMKEEISGSIGYIWF